MTPPEGGAAREGRARVRNLRLVVEYEGTRYRGWQVQPGERTVAGALQDAIHEALGERPVLIGAGRTDAGVHANGQVANFFTSTDLGSELVLADLNARLPHDVNVLEVRDVPTGFHARHDAVSRTYRYQIAVRRTAFFKTTVYWPKARLDPVRMADAAAALPGVHDFRAFGDVPPGEGSRVEMFEAEVSSHDFLILVHLRAERFLWKMVRRIVGVLVETGAGRLPVSAMEDFLRHSDRSAARLTVPPSGLFLESVQYPVRPGSGRDERSDKSERAAPTSRARPSDRARPGRGRRRG